MNLPTKTLNKPNIYKYINVGKNLCKKENSIGPTSNRLDKRPFLGWSKSIHGPFFLKQRINY